MSFNNPYEQKPANPYQASGTVGQMHHTGGGSLNPLAIISLVTGILALPFGFCCGCFGTPLGIAGVVCGLIALSQINNSNQSGKGLAIGGIACGALGLCIAILMVILGLVLDAGGGNQFNF